MPAGIPVSRPLPHIADHVGQAKAIGRIVAHWRCPHPSVRGRVLMREFALPHIRHMPAIGFQHVPPGELMPVVAAPAGIFPFGFGWQRLPGPGRIGFHILHRDMYNRMIPKPVQLGVRPGRVTPVGSEGPLPPLAPVIQPNRPGGGHENQRRRLQHLRQRTRIILRPGRHFGDGHIAGCFHKRGELPVGHRRPVDPET